MIFLYFWEVCSYGSFYRSFQLPNDIDEEGVMAKYENGVLTLTLPKEEKSKGRDIKVLKA